MPHRSSSSSPAQTPLPEFSPFRRYIAHLLQMDPADIDGKRLGQSALIVKAQRQEYWDTLAHTGQLHGNVPYKCMVAMVYACECW